MLKYIVILWALANLVWVFFYIKDTLKWKTQPNKITRLMRSIAPLIATTAALSEWIRRAVLPVFMSGFGPLLIFISSFFNKKSYRKLSKFDYVCWLLSALAIIFRAITKNASIAIILAIASDGAAALPTLIKARKYPKSESVIAYITWLFNASTSFFAIKSLWFSEIGFPIYLCITNLSLIIWIVKWKNLLRIKKNEQ